MIAELTNRAEVIFKYASDAILLTDERLSIVEANPASEQLFGYEVGEMLHQVIHKLISPKHHHIFSDLIGDMYTHHRIKRIETVALRKDGSTFWVEMSLALIDSVEWAGYVCTIRDVSDAQQQVSALQVSEAYTRAIVDASPVCILSIDVQGNFIEFNPAAERTFGYTREDVIGKPMDDLIMPDSFHKMHHNGMQRFLSTRQPKVSHHPMQLPARRADGSEFMMEMTIVPIETHNNLFFTAYIRDITNTKRPIKDSTGKLRSLDELSQE